MTSSIGKGEGSPFAREIHETWKLGKGERSTYIQNLSGDKAEGSIKGLDAYSIERLILEGLPFDAVKREVDTNGQGEFETFCKSAFKGEKRLLGSLKGEEISLIPQELKSYFPLQGIVRRVKNLFRFLFNGINLKKAVCTYSVSSLADKISRIGKKTLGKTEDTEKGDRIDQAKYLMVNLEYALSSVEATKGKLVIDPYTGIFDWKKGSFRESLESQETGHAIINAATELQKGGITQITMPGGEEVKVYDLLKKFEKNRWGRGFIANLEKRTAHLEKTPEGGFWPRMMDRFAILSESSPAMKIYMIADLLDDPRIPLASKITFIKWANERVLDKEVEDKGDLKLAKEHLCASMDMLIDRLSQNHVDVVFERLFLGLQDKGEGSGSLEIELLDRKLAIRELEVIQDLVEVLYHNIQMNFDRVRGSNHLEPLLEFLGETSHITGGGAAFYWAREIPGLHVLPSKSLGVDKMPKYLRGFEENVLVPVYKVINEVLNILNNELSDASDVRKEEIKGILSSLDSKIGKIQAYSFAPNQSQATQDRIKEIKQRLYFKPAA